MSGQGSQQRQGPQTPSTPWAGISQAAGTNSVQSTPGAAMPPVPGQTPGAAATPFQSPAIPQSGFTPQTPSQAINPTGMQTGMPGQNAATGTGNYIGAPSYLTSPAPPPAGYGLGPDAAPSGGVAPGQGLPQPGQQGYMPPTIGTGGAPR